MSIADGKGYTFSELFKMQKDESDEKIGLLVKALRKIVLADRRPVINTVDQYIYTRAGEIALSALAQSALAPDKEAATPAIVPADHAPGGPEQFAPPYNHLGPILTSATTISCSGKDITIACDDHDTKQAVMDALTGEPLVNRLQRWRIKDERLGRGTWRGIGEISNSFQRQKKDIRNDLNALYEAGQVEKLEASNGIFWRAALRPSQAAAVLPAASADAVRVALVGLLDYVDRQTCSHEETKRGGFIWTICVGCGEKWADDQGGFKPHCDAPAVAAARAALSAPVTLARPPELSIDTDALVKRLEKRVSQFDNAAMANDWSIYSRTDSKLDVDAIAALKEYGEAIRALRREG